MSHFFQLDRRFTAIAVTGGPCAGKSTFMAQAKQWLEDRGMRVVVQPEVATEFISSGFSPTEGWKNPFDFQQFLLTYMLAREGMYYEMLRSLDTERPLVLLCDRGVLDAIAYIGRDAFVDVALSVGVGIDELLERYKLVLHMVTAANGAEDFYTLGNNIARSESVEEARDLDARTLNTWIGHRNLFVVDNSGSFEVKIHRALSTLARVLDMPIPQEKERKFIFRNWNPGMIPVNSVSVSIVQDYLSFGPDGEERRVRMRVLGDSTSYYYTEKSDTGEDGVRNEVERQVSRDEYEALVSGRDLDTVTIRKMRHNIPFAGHVFQVDEYNEPVSTLVMVEVEVRDMSEDIEFPSEWDLEEVTGNRVYSNRCIAEGSLS